MLEVLIAGIRYDCRSLQTRRGDDGRDDDVRDVVKRVEQDKTLRAEQQERRECALPTPRRLVQESSQTAGPIDEATVRNNQRDRRSPTHTNEGSSNTERKSKRGAFKYVP